MEKIRPMGAPLSIPEAAVLTGRREDVIRKWVREKRIPAVRLGRDWFLDAEAIEAIRAMPTRNRQSSST